MKKWSDQEGEDFRSSDICYGREYSPATGTIDVAKISIRGEYPDEGRYGYLEESHEMAIVVREEGYVETKAGDVVYVEPMGRFRWGGNMRLIQLNTRLRR